MAKTPTILWAQRKDKLFVTGIDLPEIENPKWAITEEKFGFEGSSRNVNYKLDFDFYAPVGEAKIAVHGKQANVVIAKKEAGPWWPRLVKQAGKFGWLKTDFAKWVDEDDAEAEGSGGEEEGGMPGGMGGMGGLPPGFDISSLAGGMGGMPNMGGMGGMPGLEGMGGGDSESDEEGPNDAAADPLAADN